MNSPQTVLKGSRSPHTEGEGLAIGHSTVRRYTHSSRAEKKEDLLRINTFNES
jgi:hypothetical protein